MVHQSPSTITISMAVTYHLSPIKFIGSYIIITNLTLSLYLESLSQSGLPELPGHSLINLHLLLSLNLRHCKPV